MDTLQSGILEQAHNNLWPQEIGYAVWQVAISTWLTGDHPT